MGVVVHIHTPTDRLVLAVHTHTHRENNLENLGLEFYFAKDYEVQGDVKTFELKPGGKDILVTEENKDEYIE